MNIGICLAGNVDFSLTTYSKDKNIELWIGVDGGYNSLIKNKIKPQLLIGDLDSLEKIPKDVKIIKLNPLKDDTDGKAALNYAKNNFDNSYIYVVGIISNERIEHFLANLSLLDVNVELQTSNNRFYLLEPGNHVIENNNEKYISLFAINTVTDLTITNAKFELKDYKLDQDNPLCISNEHVNNQGINCSFKKGKLIIVLSKLYY